MFPWTTGLEVDWDGGETSVLDLHLGVNCPEGTGSVGKDLHHFVAATAVFNLNLHSFQDE